MTSSRVSDADALPEADSVRTSYINVMSRLSEIEAAIDSLSLAQKQELLLFLAARLRRERRSTPGSRSFTRDQLGAWIAEDEADLERLRD